MPLTLVPTPIGNLEDITLRAIRVLQEADLIACEDTRTSLVLLKKYGINAPVTSFHIHNENKKLPTLIGELKAGKKIAVISDAGTPGISDPGWILLKRALDEGIEVDVLPGPSAVLPGILLSGINPQPFLFLGFPPEKPGERIKLFNSLRMFHWTLCFYISPHKAAHQISEMLETFGERRCALVREISKVYQEAIRGNLSDILAQAKENIKGELILVIEGRKENPKEQEILWQAEADSMCSRGENLKDIVNALTEKYSVRKNVIKSYLLTSY